MPLVRARLPNIGINATRAGLFNCRSPSCRWLTGATVRSIFQRKVWQRKRRRRHGVCCPVPRVIQFIRMGADAEGRGQSRHPSCAPNILFLVGGSQLTDPLPGTRESVFASVSCGIDGRGARGWPAVGAHGLSPVIRHGNVPCGRSKHNSVDRGVDEGLHNCPIFSPACPSSDLEVAHSRKKAKFTLVVCVPYASAVLGYQPSGSRPILRREHAALLSDRFCSQRRARRGFFPRNTNRLPARLGPVTISDGPVNIVRCNCLD
ncbi:hypothetical protein N657DRAFT_21969 [Parathielavia appendiculata]|uniref:Uncharacterized protein n=1 Tax=Parathielavia appendiculata TaxID=2587402 RepID=A0AAN6U8I2_9PEZI|nr:hypothetical protein N657DRAFT_21969 [Parathielavia appendiculata]